MVEPQLPPEDELRLAELLEAWSRLRSGDPAVTLPSLRAKAGDLWPALMEVVDMDEALSRHMGTGTDELAGRFGRFEIAHRLGAGNFGTVYRARDTQTGRDVALKVLNTQVQLDGHVLRRFEEEGRAAVRHPHIVQIHASGTIDGRPYIAMELMEGGGLDRLLERLRRMGGAPDPRWNAALDDFGVGPAPHGMRSEGERFARRLAGLFAPLFAALGALQRGRVVNRDIKPQNLLFTRDGRLKLSDFGIAHQADRTTLTGTVQSIGTLPYMSPEQAAGNSRQVTAATDTYSLAATLYEMLTLTPPLEGETVGELLGAILTTKPTSARERQPDVPEELALVIDRCLEKAPDDRPHDPEQVEVALREIADGRPGRIRPLSLLRRATRFVDRHRVPVGVGVGMIVAALVALWIVRSQPAKVSVSSPIFDAVLSWDGVSLGRWGPAPPYTATVPAGHYVVGAVHADHPDLYEPISMPLDVGPGADVERAVTAWKAIDPEDPRLLQEVWSKRLGLAISRLPPPPGTPRGGTHGPLVLCPRGEVAPPGLILILDGARSGSRWTYRIEAEGDRTTPLFTGDLPASALADGWPLPAAWAPRLRDAGAVRVELRSEDPAGEPATAAFRLVEGAPLTDRLASLPPEARRELHPRLAVALAGLEEGRLVEAYLVCRGLIREFPKNRLVLDTALDALTRLGLDDSATYRTLHEQRTE